MKKRQSIKNKQKHIRNRAEKIMRHKRRRKEKQKVTQPNSGGNRQTSNRQIPKRKDIFLPENFNLTENYEDTMRKIDEVRLINRPVWKKYNYYINFDNIKKVGAGAALVLASEFDVSNHKSAYQAGRRYVDDNQWNAEVRSLLIDMGFHNILRLSSKVSNRRRKGTDLRFLEFYSEAIKNKPEKDMGRFLYEIGQKISDEFADGSFPVPLLDKLRSGISEAVLNTGHHAYALKHKYKVTSRWWISASLQNSTKEIKVICYDRGRSIPATVPKNFKEYLNERIKALVKELVKTKDDANLIKIAMTTDRSQVKKPGRGNGLPQLLEFIDESKSGNLVVLSRFGKVVYSKLPDNETKWEVERLPRPMLGTLIVWSIMQG